MKQQAKLQAFQCYAMNTKIEAILECQANTRQRLEGIVREWFRAVEERFSRFRPDSELSFLNTQGGKLVLVSPHMLEVLALAETYRKETGGLFTPFIHDALLAAGYDCSFEQINREHVAGSPCRPPAEPSLSLYPGMKAVRLGADTRIDLGGIVKGWSAQRLSEKLYKRHNVMRGLLNAGGDVQVWGGSDSTEPWHIGILSPWNEAEEIAIVSVRDGAVATSSVTGRRWHHERRGDMHHIIDPRTMQPSTSDVAQCSIVGESLIEAEIWAKVVCIAGRERGVSLLQTYAPRVEALIVSLMGDVHFVGDQGSLESRWEIAKVDDVSEIKTKGWSMW